MASALATKPPLHPGAQRPREARNPPPLRVLRISLLELGGLFPLCHHRQQPPRRLALPLALRALARPRLRLHRPAPCQQPGCRPH
eukprot:187224-Rhodomonas_salina.1